MKTLKYTGEKEVRLNIFLRDENLGSRREIDKFISDNKIRLNGKVATLGTKVKNGDSITISISAKKLIYAMYHKKRGEITSSLDKHKDLVPIGRLDKESEGLLIYTNDFRIVDALLNPKNKREKEYEVKIREKATPRVVTLLKKGIKTQEGKFAPVKDISIYNEGRSLRIILTEGKKHEIRRMLNALNLTIEKLVRVRIMSFNLRGIKEGEMHIMNDKEKTTLLRDCSID